MFNALDNEIFMLCVFGMDMEYPLSLAVFRCLLQLRVRFFPFLELELKYFLTTVKVYSSIAA